MSSWAVHCLLMATTFTAHANKGTGNLWKNWWDYQGITGPKFWGYINPRWSMCSKGRNQSPIDINPSSLLFDPGLSALEFWGNTMTGTLQNNGHDLTLYERKVGGGRWGNVNVTGGPLSYLYRVHHVTLRFGLHDTTGSEHTVASASFPLEVCEQFKVQMFAYNSELYSSYAQAESSPLGLAGIAVFVHISDKAHDDFEIIVRAINSTLYKGDRAVIEGFKLGRLLPPTEQYVTYEGSTTVPGCPESVTWIIYNQPIFISRSQLDRLRTLRKGTRKNPVMPMGGNIRPTQQLYQRSVRSNINFRSTKCTMTSSLHYKENGVFKGHRSR